MIIDSHTHIFPDEIAAHAIPNLIAAAGGKLESFTDGTLKGLLKSMENSKIDYSVALPVANDSSHSKEIFNWIIQSRKQTQKVVFFSSIHPADNEFKERMKEMSEEGIRGIKMHPQYQSFAVDDDAVFPIYEEAAKNELIIHFHSGQDVAFPNSDYASAPRFRKVLDQFPELKIVLAHAGGYKEWNRAYQNYHDKKVYFDISFALHHLIQKEDKYLAKLFEEKEDFFLFGTDSPWRDQKADIDLLNTSDYFSDSQKEKLLYRNAKKLLKI